MCSGKSHQHFEHMLRTVRESLIAHGHPEPKCFFTDNVAQDKNMLHRVFPSLKTNTISCTTPVNDMETLQLPVAIHVHEVPFDKMEEASIKMTEEVIKILFIEQTVIYVNYLTTRCTIRTSNWLG